MSYMYDDAERDFARRRKCNNYKRLTHDVYLYQRGGLTPYYSVRLFSTDIVDIYPDHQVLHAGGWHTMRTCKEMNAYSTLGWGATLCKGSIRINAPYAPRGSLPFFSGMRIDNSGRVFEEDRKPDQVRRVKPEVVREWTKVTAPISRSVRARCAVGEFNDTAGVAVPFRIRDCYGVLMEMVGQEMPDHDQVRDLMVCTSETVGKFPNTRDRSPEERWMAALGELRSMYYAQNDGYFYEEVPNV